MKSYPKKKTSKTNKRQIIIKYKEFGTKGEKVYVLGLGCMGMNAAFDPRYKKRKYSVENAGVGNLTLTVENLVKFQRLFDGYDSDDQVSDAYRLGLCYLQS